MDEQANELNLHKFRRIIDDFLRKNVIRMQITLPDGSLDPMITSNVGLGSTARFYILLYSIGTVCEQMQKDMGIDGKSNEWENVVHALLKMVEAELLEEPEADTAR